MPVPTDPYDFVNGTLADADQVDLRFKRLYDALNPATQGLDASNTNPAFAKDVMEPAMSIYKPIGVHAAAVFTNTIGTGNWILRGRDNADGTNPPVAVGSASALWAFYLNPADWAAGSRLVRFRVRAQLMVNATPPGTNVNVFLSAVTFAGAAGATPTISALTGASLGVAAFASPTASSQAVVDSADFALPAAGYYTLIGQTGGAIAATSVFYARGQLQVHQT